MFLMASVIFITDAYCFLYGLRPTACDLLQSRSAIAVLQISTEPTLPYPIHYPLTTIIFYTASGGRREAICRSCG